MPVLNLVHLNLHVADLERSIAFYEQLGWRVMFDLGRHQASRQALVQVNDRVDYGGGSAKAVVLSLGDDPRCATKLELMQFEDPAAEPKPERPPWQCGVHRIAMRVKDLDETLAALRGRGLPVPELVSEASTMGGRQRYVLFTDPDDNLIELIELLPA